MSIQDLKNNILQILTRATHIRSADAEADQILFHLLRIHHPSIRNYADLFALEERPGFSIDESSVREALWIADERVKGKLLQHLLEYQYFYEHEYRVNESVLVPRPETEILIREILTHCRNAHGVGAFRFGELGLGSGILSCELLSHFPHAKGVASEVSPQAIAVARRNLESVVGSNWESRFQIIEPVNSHTGFEIFRDYSSNNSEDNSENNSEDNSGNDSGNDSEESLFDVIFSNPPYVSVRDEIEEQVLKNEPHLALFPRLGQQFPGEQENPNYFYESFLLHSSGILKPGGMAFFEIPHERAETLLLEFKNAGFIHARLQEDLTGRPRVLIAQH